MALAQKQHVQSQTVATKKNDLTLMSLVNYSLGGFGFMLLLNMVGSYLMYFYTDVIGIGAGIVGTILLVTKISDAITDPIMGVVSDKFYSKKHGLYRPFLLWGVIPFVLLGISLFTVPDFITSNIGLITYAFTTYIIFNIFYTIVNVPYIAMTPSIAVDPDDRNNLLGVKKICTQLGTVIATSLTLPLVNLFSDQQTGFVVTVSVYALIVTFAILMVFKSSEKYKDRLIPSSSMGKNKIQLKTIFKALIKNDQLLLLSLAFAIETLVMVVLNQSGIYYMTYVVGNQNLVSVFNGLIGITALLCVLLIPTLAKRIEKKTFFVIGFLLASAGSLLLYFISPENIYAVMATRIITGLGMGIGGLLVYSMIADCVDYGDWKTGTRIQGMTFSFTTFLQKLGISIGGGVTGFILVYINYVPNEVQTDLSKQGIIWMNSILPAIIFFIAVLIMIPYKLTKEKVRNIQLELNSKQS